MTDNIVRYPDTVHGKLQVYKAYYCGGDGGIFAMIACKDKGAADELYTAVREAIGHEDETAAYAIEARDGNPDFVEIRLNIDALVGAMQSRGLLDTSISEEVADTPSHAAIGLEAIQHDGAMQAQRPLRAV